MDYSYLLVGSEIALSLYPQLIKLVSVDIDIQVVVRFITYSTLALVSLFTFSSSSNSINSVKKNTLDKFYNNGLCKYFARSFILL